MRELLKRYRWDLGAAGFIAVGVLVLMGVEALVSYLILGVLEISFSFDNAVVNAAVLATMSLAWQKRFMTWGILIAVVGMRFIFPVIIVAVTAKLNLVDVVVLALQHPLEYAARLEEAHPQITILAGAYLLLIFMTFFVEHFKRLNSLELLPLAITLGVVVVLSEILANPAVMTYGVVSVAMFVAVSALAGLFDDNEEDSFIDWRSLAIPGLLAATLVGLLIFGNLSALFYGTAIVAGVLLAVAAFAFIQSQDTENDEEEASADNGTPATTAAVVGGATGFAGFAKFMYLEVQDASFSFDGVSGAFAITTSVVLIALGLGIGALFVRSMTMHLLRTNARATFRYLELGTYLAIGTLAICMLTTLFVPIPEYVTGLIGVVFIGIAVWASIRANKREALQTTAATA